MALEARHSAGRDFLETKSTLFERNETIQSRLKTRSPESSSARLYFAQSSPRFILAIASWQGKKPRTSSAKLPPRFAIDSTRSVLLSSCFSSISHQMFGMQAILQDYAETSTNDFSRPEYSKGLAHLRNIAYNADIRSANPTSNTRIVGTFVAFQQNPLNFLMSYEEETFGHDFSSNLNGHSQPWWSTFQHRYYIFITLLRQLSFDLDVQLQSYVHSSRRSLRKFISEVVAKTDPDKARLFLNSMIEGDVGTLTKWRSGVWSN